MKMLNKTLKRLNVDLIWLESKSQWKIGERQMKKNQEKANYNFKKSYCCFKFVKKNTNQLEIDQQQLNKS